MKEVKKPRKKRQKNKKGFSLVELLAVIVLVAVISVFAVGGVTRYIEKARREKMNQNRSNISLAAELYLQKNRDQLPKLIGDASILKIGILREHNYLKEDVTNAKGETCMEKSFVRIYKLDDDEYSYTTYLYCGDDEVPDEPIVPKPIVMNFEFTGGTKTDGKFNDVRDAKFSFNIKGAEDDDTVGVYSYNYVIFVRGDTSDPYTEVFNSGTLKGGLEKVVSVQSKPLSQYISLTNFSNVRIDISAINEQGGRIDYSQTNGDFEDKEAPVCGSTEGEAKDDDDKSVNKVTFGANGNVPSDQLRAYPGRVSVNCTDGAGSGCKRDKFTRSWPNNSKSVSGINYKLGTRWGYVLLEDNSAKTNSTKCYVRANVDVQAPDVTINVHRAKDKKLVATLNVKDKDEVNAVMPEGTLASNKYLHLSGTSEEKWMNLENYGLDGIYIDVDIKDNLYLYSYEWKVNDPYVAGGTNDNIVASSASAANVAGEGTTIAPTGIFPSTGMTDFPRNDSELKTAEHGSLKDTIKGLKITREGKRYASLKICDKAKNCTTVHIYANIDYTPPLVPQTSYEKITTRTNYIPGTVNDYKDHNHWSKEYVRPYVDGQRDDKETQNASVKVELSGWDQFIYTYRRQSGKNGNTYTWNNPIERSIKNASGSNGRFGFDITDEGTHIVTFKSCDRAGNCSANSVDDYVKVDTIKPTCDIVTKYEENGTDITAQAKATGSTNGSGWLKIGQQVTLSHSCLDEDNKFSSGCNGDDYHNKQKYLFNSDINTSKAGANGYNATYGPNDNTAGGHVVDYAGNISDECPKMTVKIDHVAPTCKTAINWPEGNPLHPSTSGKLETGWLGLVNGTGPGKKTAKVSLVCSDPTSTGGLMTGVHSLCDDPGTYDTHKYNQQYHIYKTEMWITNAGAVGAGQGGQVIDNAGNVTPCPADRTVKIDYTVPVCKTKIEYGTGPNAAGFSKTSNGNPKNGWLGWYTNTDTTKKMAKVSQVCTDPNGNQQSGCYGNMLFKVYDYEMNVTNAGAVKEGDNGYVEDYAGNKTNCSIDGNWHTVKIDYTRPVCEVKISSTGSAANSGNNSEIVRNWAYTNYDGRWLGIGAKVTINSKCTSAESGTGNSSGCDTDTSRDYIWEIKTTNATSGGDGVDFYVFDKAGNRSAADCPKKKVQIDLTGPTCTLLSRYGKSVTNSSPIYDASTTNYQGWLDGSYKVRVSSQCTGDPLANGQTGVGCFETAIHTRDYSAASGTVLNAWKGSASDDGGYTVFDAVGNGTFCGRKQVKIDAQAPTCTVSAKTSDGASYNGKWTNASYVRVSRKCNDGSGSGCDAASTADKFKDYSTTTYWTTTTGGAVKVGDSGKIKDNVGNETTCAADRKIQLDVTKPTCSVTTSGTFGSWTNNNITITGKCDDSGSGCDTNRNGNMVDKYSSNTVATKYYSRTIYDKAGNVGSCSGGPYDIKLWKSKPSCSIDKMGHNMGNLPCESGVDLFVTCTAISGGAPLKSCADHPMPANSYKISGQSSGVNVRSSTSRSVVDMAGNTNSCNVTISNKTQNQRAYCTTCNDCTSAGCKTRNSCYKCSSGTHYTAGGSHFCCHGKKADDNETDCGLSGGKWCSGLSRCGTSITMASYGQYDSCTCAEWKRSCSTCGGCESGMGSYGNWYDGSHSAGWDGNYHYKIRTVYY